ncbi:MAG: hypothetical protein ACRCZI_03405 [Cetobacterium sp.]
MKKVVVLLKNGSDLDLILKSYAYLRSHFGFEIVPLYIRDIAYRTRISETMINSGGAVHILNELEDEFIVKTKKALSDFKIKAELIIQSSVSVDDIKNYLKTADLLMLEQGVFLNDLFIELLKISFRSILVLRGKPVNFENLSIISNDGVKVNNSVYNFLNLFPTLDIEKFPILTWNCNYDKHGLVELLKNKGYESSITKFNSKSSSIQDFYSNANKFDLVIMGNLSRSFFLEKITNRTGLNLLENLKTPIFIG